jgi:hypothetical protein
VALPYPEKILQELRGQPEIIPCPVSFLNPEQICLVSGRMVAHFRDRPYMARHPPAIKGATKNLAVDLAEESGKGGFRFCANDSNHRQVNVMEAGWG